MQLIQRKKRQAGHPLSLRDAMHQIFDESFWDPFGMFDREGWLPESSASQFVPSIDISETKDHLKVTADLPGYAPEDIKAHIQNGILTLEGTMQAEKEEKDEDEKWHRKECSSGKFFRQFSLPEYVKEEDTKCTFKNGKLTITVPKRSKDELPKQEHLLTIETG